VPDSKLNQHTNDAYLEIVDKFRFHRGRSKYTFNTVASTATHTLTNSVIAVFRVWDTTNNKWLIKMGDREFANTVPSEGQPERYARFGDDVVLVPTPDDIYTISIFGKFVPTVLSADGDAPVIPSTWDYGILLLAQHKYYYEQGDQAKSQAAFNMFNLWLQNKPSEIDEELIDVEQGVEVPSLTDNQLSLPWDNT